MVDIAKTPLLKRLQKIDQDLYTAAQQASPGQVVVSIETYNEVIDLLQELTDRVSKET